MSKKLEDKIKWLAKHMCDSQFGLSDPEEIESSLRALVEAGRRGQEQIDGDLKAISRQEIKISVGNEYKIRVVSDCDGVAIYQILNDELICLFTESVERIEARSENAKLSVEINNFREVTNVIREYNPKYGDDRECQCRHEYYRHFDTYDNMRSAGCKYCDCDEFIEYAIWPTV